MTTPQPAALPEPFAWAWHNKVTGAKGVYFEDPQPFGVTSHPDYEWTHLYNEAQVIAALQSQPASPGVTGAVQTLIETLKADPEYAWAWHCNVAMAAVDEGLSHYAANKAAARFLSWFAQIDTTKHPGFPKAPEQPAAAGVSDEELRQAVDALRDPNTVSAFYNGYYTLTPDELRRAILALRPQSESDARRAAQEQLYTERERHTAEVKRLQAEIGRLQSLRSQAVPMTEEQVNAANPYKHSANHRSVWINGFRAAERLYGITAQGAQGGEAK